MKSMMAPLLEIRRRRRLTTAATALVIGMLSPTCRKEEPKTEKVAEATPVNRDLLVFPDALRVSEPTINEFVTRSMEVCAAGDYEAFRLLWSARDEPLPRAEFEQGWKAVETIRIRALEKVQLAPDPDSGRSEAQVVYTVYAQVELDPALRSQGVETKREVVLMIVREQDKWRLARAPKAMRAWIRERYGGEEGNDADKPDAPTPVETPG